MYTHLDQERDKLAIMVGTGMVLLTAAGMGLAEINDIANTAIIDERFLLGIGAITEEQFFEKLSPEELEMWAGDPTLD